ncbi:MAG: hypothetical protein Q8O52_17165 [Sulfuritalea sp.]|nr:hypothetical protein [Sulfuritalea sp.]
MSACARLPPPQRLPLLAAVLGRFFAAMGAIRQMVLINPVLGVVTIAIALAGP